MRQLITLNARCKEQGEYLHTIMMTVKDIQEKQDILSNQTTFTAVLSTTYDEIENICGLLPIPNEESLINLQEALTNNKNLFDKMVCKYVQIII